MKKFSYPLVGREKPRETFVQSDGTTDIVFGLLIVLVGWLTKEFAPSFGLLFVAYGLGYYKGADAAFRRVEQD
jgi:hypothetical protein